MRVLRASVAHTGNHADHDQKGTHHDQKGTHRHQEGPHHDQKDPHHDQEHEATKARFSGGSTAYTKVQDSKHPKFFYKIKVPEGEASQPSKQLETPTHGQHHHTGK